MKWILVSILFVMGIQNANAVTAGLALTPYKGNDLKTAWISGYVAGGAGRYTIRLPELRHFGFDEHSGINLISLKTDELAVGQSICKGLGSSLEAVSTVPLRVTEDHVVTVQRNLVVRLVHTRPGDPNTGLVLFQSVSCR